VGNERLRRPLRGRPLTDRDRELLLFLAEHRMVLSSQVQTLLGASAEAARRRLRALAAQGYVASGPLFSGQPDCCHIRPRGLAVAGSDLPAPRLKLAYYEHDVGLAWIWLAAKRGAFGPLREVVSERRMRSRDGRLAEEPFGGEASGRQDVRRHEGDSLGVRLGAVGRSGRDRLHYPDLLLVMPEGKRIAIELELSSKGRARLEGILLGYASDGRIDGVLYLVADRADGRRLGRTIRDSARRLGIGDLVAVRRLRIKGWGTGSDGADRGRDRRRNLAELTL